MASKSEGGGQATPPTHFFQKLASGVPGVGECIAELLLSIGHFFDVDRACLCAFSDGYDLMNNTREWCSLGVPSLIDLPAGCSD